MNTVMMYGLAAIMIFFIATITASVILGIVLLVRRSVRRAPAEQPSSDSATRIR